jgi:hypothetical protein
MLLQFPETLRYVIPGAPKLVDCKLSRCESFAKEMHREKASLDACIHYHAAQQPINSNFDSLRWKSDLYTRFKNLQALKVRNLTRG